jgi:hypothetical protein
MAAWRTPFAGALALAVALTPMSPLMGTAAAAPPVPMAPAAAQTEAGGIVTQVRGRHHGRHGRYYGRHRHSGRNIGIGLGLGIIGGIIASEAYRSAPAYAYDEEVYEDGDPRVQCAREFRSFEWNTGLYTTFGGEKKLCPYLR